jgi:thiol-disulfide isomerase/thioredoxin
VIPALFLYVSLVNDVRGLIARNDLAAAEALARSNEARSGSTSEAAAAMSWVARAWLNARQYDKADRLAAETTKLAEGVLRNRKLDADPWLPTAVGAAIEVHGQALAGRGQRAEAVAYLREQLAAYRGTSIAERIGKNINLLSLEGKVAPALNIQEHLGTTVPRPLVALRGHPVLLFFWAHWCSDCKALAPVVASLMRSYGPQGLVLVAPTRRYGYVAGGEDASPAAERQYIEKVRAQYYGVLPPTTPMPVSEANFLAYGASSTPTLALIDAAGVVRYYHPGAASEAELADRIQKLLKK